MKEVKMAGVQDDNRVWHAGAWRRPEGVKNHKAAGDAARGKARRFMIAVKMTAGCTDCGYDRCPAALSFDHRDPTNKRFNVGMTGPRSIKLLVEEMEKCDVRCENCHRERHYYEKGRENS